jgi:hypothetical protein
MFYILVMKILELFMRFLQMSLQLSGRTSNRGVTHSGLESGVLHNKNPHRWPSQGSGDFFHDRDKSLHLNEKSVGGISPSGHVFFIYEIFK